LKAVVKQFSKKAAFTIVELLTVMSIIIILIGLLVPSLNMVKKYARTVKQRKQFYSIDVAMELFNNEWDGYPDSEYETTPDGYCGAMKLCEAMMGQDLLGFHPDSHFRSDGTINGTPATQLYGLPPADPRYADNLKSRKGPYLQLENASAHKLMDLYGTGNTGPFNEQSFVLCDVYNRVKNRSTGKRVGMPILYYKANTSGMVHNPNIPAHPQNIYDYEDNDELVELGAPWDPTITHPLHRVPGEPTEGRRFYEITKDERITIKLGRPHRSDSYILISAGFDGEYGTPDDVFNFGD